MADKVVLKPGKEKALLQRHPWIFSGAVASGAEGRSGDLLPVYSSNGTLLGSGYFNSRSSIVGRMLCFDERPPLQAFEENLKRAIELRREIFAHTDITGYRVVNGEGDDLPGLVVDRYADLCVIQIATLGMEKLRDKVVEILKTELQPKAIYEKSALPTRAEEALKDRQEWLFGERLQMVEITENALRFNVRVEEGQKTGFYLDHREMRRLVNRYAYGRRVLNCFSYTGAFSIAALAGEAASVTSVDASSKALKGAEEHVLLNGFLPDLHRTVEGDVFQFLRDDPLDYNFVILDPPAFAKRRTDVIQACRGYKDINRLAMSKVPKGSFLLTSSCSHFVDDVLFQQVVFQAAAEAKRSVRILDRHHYAHDHPVNIYHPEAHYLKSLFLYID